ncbi:MAG: PIG-L family deacetylase [Balneola sp.]
MKKIVVLLALFVTGSVFAQDSTLSYQPKILLITAHPDDDALFSATVWKTTKLLDGTVDLALMTNGEGGYKYSTLGNYVYDKDLDEEEVGRDYLPGIRKKELMAGGDVVGIRNYFFFDQQDFYYTQDIEETLEKWDTDAVEKRLADIMSKEDYDFIFMMLPFDGNHGHHKAATLLGLRAIKSLPEAERPIALPSFVRRTTEGESMKFDMMAGYPITKVKPNTLFEFDRNQKFGFNNRLDYNIIANWVIAEHKSQGTMQLLMRNGVIEQYWFAELNSDDDLDKTRKFFEVINTIQPD